MSDLTNVTSKFSKLHLSSGTVGWEEVVSFPNKTIPVGTRLQVRVNFVQYGDKYLFRLANSLQIDGRYVDSFYLEENQLNAQQLNYLKQLNMLEIEVIIEVGELLHPDYTISMCMDYEVLNFEIIKIEQVDNNPDFLLDQDYTLIGTVLALTIGLKHSDDTILEIETESGDTFTFRSPYSIKYSTSNQTPLFSELLNDGDKIQVKVKQKSGQTLPTLCAIHLLEECDTIKSLRNALQMKFIALIDEIKSSEDWIVVKHKVASLLAYNTSSSFHRTLLSSEQISLLIATITVKHGLESVPFVLRMNSKDLYEMEAIGKQFNNKLIYAYSVSEFLELCNQISTRQIITNGNGSPDYHYRYLNKMVRDGLVEQSQVDSILLRTFITYSRFLQNAQCVRIERTEREGALDYATEYSFDDMYLMEQTLKYMCNNEGNSEVFNSQLLALLQSYQAQFEVIAMNVNSLTLDSRTEFPDLRENFSHNVMDTLVHLTFVNNANVNKRYLLENIKPKVQALLVTIIGYLEPDSNAVTEDSVHYLRCAGYECEYILRAIKKLEQP